MTTEAAIRVKFRALGSRLDEHTRRVWAAIFCACAVLQVWGAVYAFFFFGLLTGIAAVLALGLSESRRALFRVVRRDIGIWILLLALSAVAVAPLLEHYGMTAAELGYRHYSPKHVAVVLQQRSHRVC